MIITALCMTHGRNWCLREAVESFRRQALPPDVCLDLLILNDCPQQKIVCALPDVRVENVREILDLGLKQNAGVEMSSGEWVMLWDDDDISLPHRVRILCDYAARYPDSKAFCSKRAWYCDHDVLLNVAANLFCGSAFFRRDYYLECGGAVQNKAPDQSAWFAMERRGCTMEVEHPTPEIQYIYRWAGVGVHDSGLHWQNGTIRHKAFSQAVQIDRRFTSGRVEILPGWNRDYVADVEDAIKTGRTEVV